MRILPDEWPKRCHRTLLAALIENSRPSVWSYVTYRRGARLITGHGFHEFAKTLPPSEAVTPSRRLAPTKARARPETEASATP